MKKIVLGAFILASFMVSNVALAEDTSGTVDAKAVVVGGIEIDVPENIDSGYAGLNLGTMAIGETSTTYEDNDIGTIEQDDSHGADVTVSIDEGADGIAVYYDSDTSVTLENADGDTMDVSLYLTDGNDAVQVARGDINTTTYWQGLDNGEISFLVHGTMDAAADKSGTFEGTFNVYARVD